MSFRLIHDPLYVPRAGYIFGASFLASALTCGVFVASLFAIGVFNNLFDTSSLQGWLRPLSGFFLMISLVLVIAFPVWLVVVGWSYLSGALLFSWRHRGKVRIWRLWLAVWAACAALSLALIQWTAGGLMDLLATFAGLIGPALFQVAQASWTDPMPSQIGPNAAIFACIGWLSGGVLSKQARRFSAAQAEDVR